MNDLENYELQSNSRGREKCASLGLPIGFISRLVCSCHPFRSCRHPFTWVNGLTKVNGQLSAERNAGQWVPLVIRVAQDFSMIVEGGVEDGRRGEDGAGRVECSRVSCIPKMHHDMMVHVHTNENIVQRWRCATACECRNKFATVATNLRRLATRG